MDCLPQVVLNSEKQILRNNPHNSSKITQHIGLEGHGMTVLLMAGCRPMQDKNILLGTAVPHFDSIRTELASRKSTFGMTN